ncbi:MAG: tetratricopeptide repeat protein [Burkholderiales bacterium]|nr:tetratricopeptide repeat protein [Burkholderiales bacterium]
MTVDTALQQAIGFHRAGQLQDAEQLYRAILQAVPQHPAANYNLGALAVQVGQYAAALPHFKLALEANSTVPQYWMSYIDALIESGQVDTARDVLEQGVQKSLQGAEGAYFNLGITYYAMGRAADAEDSYRKALKINPRFAEALNNLGAVLREKGLLEEAASYFKLALKINPGFAEAHSNMGNVYKDEKKYAQAEASYKQALKLRHDFIEAELNLAIVCKLLNRLDEAESKFRHILAVRPSTIEAYNGLGDVLQLQNRIPEAETTYRTGLEANPHSAELHYNLGVIFQKQNRLVEAEQNYRRALEIKPDFLTAFPNLAAVYNHQRKHVEAEAICRRALQLAPQDVGILNNLGIALKETIRPDEAERIFLEALKIQPDLAETHCNLASVFHDQGRFSEAAAHYRQAVALDPEFAGAYSNLLFCLSHDETVDGVTLYAEYCRFGEHFEAPLRSSWPNHANSRDPRRPLHIGIVSADFRYHAVANFIEPVLSQWANDPSLVLHAYYNYAAEDHVTPQIRAHFAHWNTVLGLSDKELAKKIEADGIDILIDLSGHTAGNRLLTFAHRPAPIQATWIGTACTTGLQAMDYYLADRHFLPAGQFDEQYTEKIVRLPAAVPFLPSDAAPDINALPALSNKRITFGSFNRLSKLSRPVIALWAQVLRALPTSRMLLGAMPLAGSYDTLLGWFADEGIDRSRLSFHDRCGMGEYLRLHQQVDICLDTFPYNGGTTTLHALWMGVPTLTLAGKTPVGRAGTAGLCHVGMEDFIAGTKDEFVQKAVEWANKPQELAQLRQELRSRVAASPMGQPAVLTSGLTQALRTMWQRWCDGLSAVSFEISGEALPTQPNSTKQSSAKPVKAVAKHLPPPRAEIDQLVALYNQGRLAEADTVARSLTHRFPHDGFGWKVLSLIAIRTGADASISAIKATELLPNDPDTYYNLGMVQEGKGQLVDAANSYQRAIKLNPQYIDAHNNLGNVFKALGKAQDAEASYRQALKFNPSYAKAHNNLGTLLTEEHHYAEAETHLRQALALVPDYPEAYNNLGNLLLGRYQYGKAAELFRNALQRNPQFAEAQSNLLFCMSYDETVDAATLFEEHRRFGERFEQPLRSLWPQHANSRDPNRPLRIGLVSADFRTHAVTNFFEPVLSEWAKDTSLVLHAYYNHADEDHITRHLRSLVAHWRGVTELNDEQLARQIQADGIDILIDLSGHTAGNRLLAFARKPAPLQISWIGSACTTGLASMDYYFADRHFLPLGQFDDQYTEKIVRLPAGVPFTPTADAPPVNGLPALSNGYITFGSFNRIIKLNRPVIALWAQVLRALPTSRMFIAGMPQNGGYENLLDWFAAEGIEHNRLSLHGRCIMTEYLALHQQVDICLDTFPYNGGTTTLHALWMGVPTLSLAGNTPVGRAGAAGLYHAGLEDFIADTKEAFVHRALEWADKKRELAQLRQELRGRVAASPMRQPAVLAKGLTAAMRIMWQRWCNGLPAASFEVTEHS